ncbi:MAG: hypothetical protein J0I29_12045 [Rhizobiales bacterium]|nr:hypothetical protein [Hyphomicrobiales bacterium]
MRRSAVILLACAVGLGTAFAFAYVAGLMTPCRGEQLTCSMTKIIGLIYIPVFSAVALIAFSIAIFWKDTIQAVNIAAAVPLGVFLLFIAYVKWSEFSVREFHDIRERDIQELLQVVLPIVLTLTVPWVALHKFVSRTGKISHG